KPLDRADQRQARHLDQIVERFSAIVEATRQRHCQTCVALDNPIPDLLRASVGEFGKERFFVFPINHESVDLLRNIEN
ncbi:MAG: hypothetical protein QOF21_2722, partial [Actinomycetota bacterium]